MTTKIGTETVEVLGERNSPLLDGSMAIAKKLKVKLAKALRLKNFAIEEIKRLQKLIGDNNSTREDSPKLYPVNTLFHQLLIQIENLAELKYAIENANAVIRGNIVRMAEAKSLISFLSELVVFEGLKSPHGRIGRFFSEPDAAKEVRYTATIKAEQKEALLKRLHAEIATMDDRRQDYNGETSVEVWLIEVD